MEKERRAQVLPKCKRHMGPYLLIFSFKVRGAATGGGVVVENCLCLMVVGKKVHFLVCVLGGWRKKERLRVLELERVCVCVCRGFV